MENDKQHQVNQPLESERLLFKTFLVKNPNYFGTLAKAAQKPVKVMSAVTSYEELTAVSFNPDTRNLEATFIVKKAFGYNGSLCSAGSFEYIRFFMDYGLGWEDQGVVGVNVHDIPTGTDCEKESTKPLTYTATLPIQPHADKCSHAVLPKVRAILSWQIIPTALDPDYPVVWGNKLECNVQIKPFWLPITTVSSYMDEFFKIAESSPSLQISQVKDIVLSQFPGIQTELQQAEHEHSLLELKNLYAQHKEVAAARYGFTHLQAALLSPSLSASYQSIWKSAELDWTKILEEVLEKKANTFYEELETIGLDYTLERLVASFRIKKPYGYLGDLCKAGSREYVAFWADWNDDCNWSYLGTVAVSVHDIAAVPPEGICYAAILPVNLSAHRKKCSNPNVVRVRAVLSWQTPPSVTDPNALQFYGNMKDAHVQIKPGVPLNPGEVKPIIVVLGGIPEDKIENGTGLTHNDAFFALSGLSPDPLGRPCPFGGRVVLQGPSFPGYKYRVQVRPVGSIAWTNVLTPLTLVGWQFSPPYIVYTVNAPDAFGYYDFQEFTNNIDNVLAWWDTSGNALWEIKLEIPGHGEMIKRIQLDHTAPSATIEIDNGGNCKDFTQGDVIHGHFVTQDDYFGSFSIQADLDPADITVYDQTVSAPGHGWKIDTSTWLPCGYTVYLNASDRSILNSGPGAHNYNSAHVGFCLRKK